SFNRPPRIWISPPQETVNIPAPPAKESLPPMPGVLSLILPIFMMSTIFAVYIFVNHSSMQQLSFLLPMAIFSVMTPVANILGAYQKVRATRRQWKISDKKYRKVLAGLRKHL